MAAAALAAGKSVWVEKPLAITWEGLAEVAAAAGEGVLVVGHNRRFAPFAVQLAKRWAVQVHPDSRRGGPWPRPLARGSGEGGRVLGEISHFVDLASFLAGAPPESVSAVTVPGGAGDESLAALLRFPGGSAATIAYGVGRAEGMPKERIEVLAAGGAAVLDDFRRLELQGRVRRPKGCRDKGPGTIRGVRCRCAGGGPAPVAIEKQLLVAAASLALLDSARTGAPVDVRLPA